MLARTSLQLKLFGIFEKKITIILYDFVQNTFDVKKLIFNLLISL